MKIVSVIGSPRKQGNCVAIVGKICEAAVKNGHEVSTFYLYDQVVNPCIACEACTDRKVDLCIHNDDFNKIAGEIIGADAIILASPIYMGHVTGPVKTFLDRFYTFAEEHFSIRHIEGKRFITVTTSGAPAEHYSSVTDYLKYWLGEFFKMTYSGSIIAGDLMEQGEAKERQDLMDQAESLGSSLL